MLKNDSPDFQDLRNRDAVLGSCSARLHRAAHLTRIFVDGPTPGVARGHVHGRHKHCSSRPTRCTSPRPDTSLLRARTQRREGLYATSKSRLTSSSTRSPTFQVFQAFQVFQVFQLAGMASVPHAAAKFQLTHALCTDLPELPVKIENNSDLQVEF